VTKVAKSSRNALLHVNYKLDNRREAPELFVGKQTMKGLERHLAQGSP